MGINLVDEHILTKKAPMSLVHNYTHPGMLAIIQNERQRAEMYSF